jgi:hypothetical protein
MSAKFVWCVFLLVVGKVACHREEIPDFEFEDGFGATPTRENAFGFDDFDEFFVEDAEYDIAAKEKIIHNALLKALAAKELVNCFKLFFQRKIN